ncbi:MAG: ABC transporter ATP-binding protein [Pseudomonadota bacterium]
MPGFDKTDLPLMRLGSADPPILRVDQVSRRFGKVEVVSQVSFSVQAGSIFGFVGSDGAGKTTLLRMIAAMIRPSTGQIQIDGLDVVQDRTRVKERIGYMPQRFGLYSDLTVAENMDFFMDIFGIFGSERKKRKDQYLGFSNLTPFQDRLARDLSGGMKQKLGLACVLVHQPRVLILDEPTNGVDPVSRKEFWEILCAMRKEGMTILVSTSYLDEGEKCDQIILMHNAHVLDQATPAAFRADFSSLEAAMIHRIEASDKILSGEHFDI